MISDFEHLNMHDWPFRVVPSRESAGIWVGRPEVLRKISRIARRASTSGVAELILLWADFGAGKTHALRHLEVLAGANPRLMPIYFATPKGVRSFADVYSAIVDAVIESGALDAAGRDLFDRTKGNVNSDLDRAVIRIAHYPEDSLVATSWLRGDKVYLKDLRDIGIGSRIESSQDAIRALNGLIEILQRDGEVTVMLLIDEMQEFGLLTDRQLDECIGGFQKVFNHNEMGLTFVMSFTSGTQATIKSVIGEALYDRAGQRLSLEPLERSEAVEFLRMLLESRMIDKSKSPWPFTDESLEALVEHVDVSTQPLTPRQIIKAADLVFSEAVIDIEDEEIVEISAAYAEKTLVDVGSESIDASS